MHRPCQGQRLLRSQDPGPQGACCLAPGRDLSVLCLLKVSIHSVWLGNSITPLREEEWDEEEEEEADVPAPSSPPVSPVNSRSPSAFWF